MDNNFTISTMFSYRKILRKNYWVVKLNVLQSKIFKSIRTAFPSQLFSPPMSPLDLCSSHSPRPAPPDLSTSFHIPHSDTSPSLIPSLKESFCSPDSSLYIEIISQERQGVFLFALTLWFELPSCPCNRFFYCAHNILCAFQYRWDIWTFLAAYLFTSPTMLY